MRKRRTPFGWPRHDPRHSRFPIPNTVWEYHLKPIEFIILSYLCCQHSHGGANLSPEMIAEVIHKSESTAKTHLSVLADAGSVTEGCSLAADFLSAEIGKFFTLPKERRDISDLYKRIDSICKENGTNVTALCKKAGVGRATLSELNAGRTKTLNADTVTKLAAALGVSVDYLLGTEEKKTPRPSLRRTGAMWQNWKDLAMIKFCLAAIGVVIGAFLPEKRRKPAIWISGGIFAATYLPLMAKFFRIVTEQPVSEREP